MEEENMKLLAKTGQEVEVVIDSKTMMATVDGRKLAVVKDNKFKVWNDTILTDQSLNVVREEMEKFIKKVETGKKK